MYVCMYMCMCELHICTRAMPAPMHRVRVPGPQLRRYVDGRDGYDRALYRPAPAARRDSSCQGPGFTARRRSFRESSSRGHTYFVSPLFSLFLFTLLHFLFATYIRSVCQNESHRNINSADDDDDKKTPCLSNQICLR